MAAKLLGKLLQFKFDGSEKYIEGEDYSAEATVVDVTDTETSGDGMETLVGRWTRTLAVTIFLRDGSGKKIIPKSMNLNFDGVDYPLADFGYSVKYDEIDVTDGATPGDGTEWLGGFATRQSSFGLWVKDTVSDPAEGVSKSAIVTLLSGLTISGNLRIESKKKAGKVKGAIKYDGNATWQGAVTDSSLNLLPMAVEKPIELIFKTGGSQDNKISGNGTILEMSFSGNINDGLLINYLIKFSGSVNETVYAA